MAALAGASDGVPTCSTLLVSQLLHNASSEREVKMSGVADTVSTMLSVVAKHLCDVHMRLNAAKQ